MFQLLMNFVRHNKKMIIVGLVVALAVGFRIISGAGKPPPPMFSVVETQIVEKGKIVRTMRFVGTVKSTNYCVLIAKASGTIDTLEPAGSVMKKGALLAKIENPDIEKTYDLCVSAEHIASAQYERSKGLAKSGASSKGSLEDKEAALINARKAMSSAKLDLDNSIVKAPFNGVLGVYKVKDGEQVSQGTQIASFYNPDEILIEFDVPEECISYVKDGQGVFIGKDKYKLTHIQRAIDEDKHMCPSYLKISNKDDKFTIGSFINMDLVLEEKESAIIVPSDSVFIRGGKDFVYTVKDGKAVMKEVAIGIRQKEEIEIIKGLDIGDDIIITGTERRSLFNGSSVKTVKELSKKSENPSKEKNK